MNPSILKYDEDFLHFCYKSIQKDFSTLPIKAFFMDFLDNMHKKQENSLLFPIKRIY